MSTLTPLLSTGLNGLVGSKFARDFADAYECTNLDISDPQKPVDITKLDQVQTVVSTSEAPFIIHLAAFTNVSAAWEDRGNKDGPAYQVNVVGTENIVKAAAAAGKHLIHISTAYVFNGEKVEPYLETDPTQALDWYGQTKEMAEKVVQASSIPWTILRIDQPFRSDHFARPDVIHRIVNGLQNQNLPPQFDDHFIGPTYLDDFSKILDWVIRTKTTGLFHASSGEQWSDFELAQVVQTQFGLPGEVKPGKLENYLKTISRPYQKNSALNTTKLFSLLDFKPKTIKEAVAEVTL